MTTIGEKQASNEQLIADIASAAINHTSDNWSDADTSVDQSRSDGSYENNGRVLEHSPTGSFLLMYPGSNSVGDEVVGVRMCISNSWDGTNHIPDGKTTVTSEDPFSGSVGSHWTASCDNFTDDANSPLSTFAVSHADMHAGGWSISKARDLDVTYFASVGANYINTATWNTTDSDYGSAGIFSWEYLTSKFWSDGYLPVAFQNSCNADSQYGHQTTGYGFAHGWRNNTGASNHPYTGTGFGRGAWGNVNPDSNDDTFFFRRPVAYQSPAQDIPVAFMEDQFSNHETDGGAHGDVITHDTTDYRVIRQSGAGHGDIVSRAMRHE